MFRLDRSRETLVAITASAAVNLLSLNQVHANYRRHLDSLERGWQLPKALPIVTDEVPKLKGALYSIFAPVFDLPQA